MVTDSNLVTVNASVTISEPAVLSASIVGTDVNCNGGSDGSADLTVSGGTAPYYYDWTLTNNEDLYNVSQGTYYVDVTDNKGCIISDSVIISQPAFALNVVSSVKNVDCFNNLTGEVSLTVTGGTSPYSYLWSNGTSNDSLINVFAGNYTGTVTDANGCSSIISVTITQPLTLSAFISKTNISCFGDSNGVADLFVSGGTTPYTFNWSNALTTEDLSGLAADTFTVTITDANLCQTVSTVTITEPTILSASVTVEDVKCYGNSTGMIDLVVSGGTLPYNYLWSNGFNSQDLSNLSADYYCVTVTDFKGCTATLCDSVRQPFAALSASITGVNINCNGQNTGSVDLTVSGGTPDSIAPFYDYYWNYGWNTEDTVNIYAGNYSVTVIDNNYCMTTSLITITQPATAITLILSSNNVLCFGDTSGSVYSVTFGGTAPYTYLWNTGDTISNITNIPAGNYILTVTDSKGCIKTDSVYITEPNILDVQLFAQDVKCKGDLTGNISSFVQGGKQTYSYIWNSGLVSPTISNLPADIYWLTVTDGNGCMTVTNDTIFEPDSVLSVNILLSTITCFSNNDAYIDLTVWGGTPNDTLPSYTYSWSNGENIQDLDSLNPGLYIVTISDKNSCTIDTSVLINGKPLVYITGNNVTCFGLNDGSATANVGGGTQPYTYTWLPSGNSQTISGLSAGSYQVIVSDIQNCIDTALITITQPDSLIVTPTVSAVKTCN